MPRSDSQQVAAQRVWLAVLGKHPGWNDHLDDIGLDTERLVAVKRHLYVDGIGGAINAGTWESLSDEDRDDGFAHTFFWRQPDGMVIGRMWSSSDGKGRKKYPMIACAMCRSLPFSFVAGPLLERLRRLETQCRDVTTASEVIGATDKMRAEITELASFAPELDGTPVAGDGAGPSSAQTLIESGRLGEDGVGLRRVIYQMDREMNAYIRPEGSGTASRSRSVEVRGQHIRVPAPSGTVAPGNEQKDLGLWTRLLLNKIDPLVPIFLVSKDGRDWVDIIVGELGPTPLACLQSSTESIPYVSDIPFTIDGEISTSIDAMIESSRSGQVIEKDPCFVDVPQDRLAPFLRPRSSEPTAASKERKPTLLIAGVAAVVVIALIVFFATRGSGGGNQLGASGETETPGSADEDADPPGSSKTRTEPRTERTPGVEKTPRASNVQTTQPVLVEDTSAEESVASESAFEITIPADPAGRLAAFRRWCDLHTSWYLPFVASIDAASIPGDPLFRQRLAAALDSAQDGGDRLDPLISTPGRFRQLDTLVESPPEEIYTDEFVETLAAGLGPIESIRHELSQDRWAAREALGRLDTLVRDQGGTLPSEFVALSDEIDGTDGAVSADAVGRLTALGDELGSCVGTFEELDRVRRDVSGLQADTAGNAYRLLHVPFEDESSGNQWLVSTQKSASELTTLGKTLIDAATNGYPRVDPELFAERVDPIGDAAGPQDVRAFLSAWINAANDETLYLLDSADDPRQGLAAQSRVDRVRGTLESLAAAEENAETQELAGMLAAYTGSAEEIRSLSWNVATEQRVTEGVSELGEMFARIAERVDAESRRRAIEAEQYIAGLRSTDSVTTTGSAAIDKAWIRARDEAIAQFESDGDVVSLSRAIDESKERLTRIDASMPRPELPGDLPDALASDLQAALGTGRERWILALVQPDQDPDEQAAFTEYTEWVGGVRDGLAAFRLLQVGSSKWDGPGDASDPVEQAARWTGTWVADNTDWTEVVPEIAAYVSALTSDDPDELAAIAARSEEHASAAFVAWTRLDDVDSSWGSSIDHIELDQRAAAALSQASAELSEDRRTSIGQRIAGITTARWLRAADSIDADQFSTLAQLAGDLPLDFDAIPAAVQFNLFIHRLRRGLRNGESFDREALTDQARSILDSIENGSIDAGSDGRDWLARFIDELDAREGREIDYRVIGPARAGWAVAPFDSGRLLRYSWTGADKPRELVFRLVESPEAGVFYLSETEAPAWLLIDFALGGAHADSVAATLPEDWDPIPDTRLGPRVWDWGRVRGGRGIRIARTWVTRDRGSDRPFYAAGFEESVGRPSEDHPIQRVGADAAAMVAAAVGCRLPTEAEWRAAHASMGSPVPSGDWNLRDAAFDTQRAHTVALGSALAVTWPDQQSFADGIDGTPQGPTAESHGWSDGVLWFVEIDSGRERPFRHLLGNVAEYVLPDLSSPELLTDRGGDVAGRVRALAGGSKVLPVIGGSALSPPSVTHDRVSVPAIETGELGYTDVGFRLAFSPGVEAPLVVVVGELLGDAPFLRSAD